MVCVVDAQFSNQESGSGVATASASAARGAARSGDAGPLCRSQNAGDADTARTGRAALVVDVGTAVPADITGGVPGGIPGDRAVDVASAGRCHGCSGSARLLHSRHLARPPQRPPPARAGQPFSRCARHDPPVCRGRHGPGCGDGAGREGNPHDLRATLRRVAPDRAGDARRGVTPAGAQPFCAARRDR